MNEDKGEEDQEEKDDKAPLKITELIERNPDMNEPIIGGLLRRGEVCNVIASPKVGKSFLMADLAINVAMGGTFLDRYKCTKGKILLIDNELHAGTLSNRLQSLLQAKGIPSDDIADNFLIKQTRGEVFGIEEIGEYLKLYGSGIDAVILDCWYRFAGLKNENDNSEVRAAYDALDMIAMKTGLAFILVHHMSKGNQADKSVTDMGAGAGAFARAADYHLTIIPHKEQDCFIVQSAARSWPPDQPYVIRRNYPVFEVDNDLSPEDIKGAKPKREEREKIKWTAEDFLKAFFPNNEPTSYYQIIETGKTIVGINKSVINKMIKELKELKKIKSNRFGQLERIYDN
jgi:RecA-family ATPase